MKQTTNSILMVRPVAFRMNEQTAVNNYQKSIRRSLPATVNAKRKKNLILSSKSLELLALM
jgi:hypothetical protein